MRSVYIFSIVISVVLGACSERNNCATSDKHCDVAPATAIQYITAPAQAQAETSRILPIHIDRNFDGYERAKILRAVNEWNHALNGQMRLDIASDRFDTTSFLTAARPRLDGWIVAKADSSHGLLRAPGMRRTLALTFSGSRQGALVLVAADRVGSRDLGAIMLHEFGHALGLGHDAASPLMHPYYAESRTHCIDRHAALGVAAKQGLAPDRLNWCDGPQEARQRTPRGHRRMAER